ncbi:MAG: hypothetical protein ACXVCP_19665 [Bdellovibrio sp.]
MKFFIVMIAGLISVTPAFAESYWDTYRIEITEMCIFKIDNSFKHLITYLRNDGYRFTNATVTDAIGDTEALQGKITLGWFATHYDNDIYYANSTRGRLKDRLKVLKTSCQNIGKEVCDAKIQNISTNEDKDGRVIETVQEEFKASCYKWLNDNHSTYEVYHKY